MACTITLTGINNDCAANLSGLVKILVGSQDNAKFTKGTDGTVTVGEGAQFYEYIPAKNTGSLTKTLTKDESTGVLYYTNELVAQFNKMSVDNAKEIEELAKGRLALIAVDKNGMNWALGVDDWVSVSAVSGQTGAGIDDGNFWTITFTEYSQSPAYHVTSLPSAN
jgi:hypothetical protein